MRDERVRLTDVDTRRLRRLVDGFRPADLRDAASVALLGRQMDEAEVLPARRIDADVVTMDSQVVVRDLDTHQTIVFRVVLPSTAYADARRISSAGAPRDGGPRPSRGRARHLANAGRPSPVACGSGPLPAGAGGEGPGMTLRSTAERGLRGLMKPPVSTVSSRVDAGPVVDPAQAPRPAPWETRQQTRGRG